MSLTSVHGESQAQPRDRRREAGDGDAGVQGLAASRGDKVPTRKAGRVADRGAPEVLAQINQRTGSAPSVARRTGV